MVYDVGTTGHHIPRRVLDASLHSLKSSLKKIVIDPLLRYSESQNGFAAGEAGPFSA